MKKVILLIIIILGSLTGCGGISDSDYINTVKNINTNNNEKIEDFTNRLLKQSEFYLLNKNSLDFEDHQIKRIALVYQIAPNEMFKQIKDIKLMLPELKNLKWRVEGETKKGKVVIVSTNLVLVRIPTEQNGDYIELNPKDIKVYDKKTDFEINVNKIDMAYIYLDIMDRYGYKYQTKEYMNKFFDPQDYLNGISEDDCDGKEKVQFYPDGRVKCLVGYDSDFNFKDESLIPSISELIEKFRLSEIQYNPKDVEDYNINTYSDGIQAYIIAEKLNKKITDSEKKQISFLEEIVSPIYQEFWLKNYQGTNY